LEKKGADRVLSAGLAHTSASATKRERKEKKPSAALYKKESGSTIKSKVWGQKGGKLRQSGEYLTNGRDSKKGIENGQG